MSSTTVSDHISSQTTVSTTQSDAGLIRSLEICLVLVVLLLVITITLFALYVRRTRILHRDRKLPRPFVNTNPLNSPFSSLDGHSPQFCTHDFLALDIRSFLFLLQHIPLDPICASRQGDLTVHGKSRIQERRSHLQGYQILCLRRLLQHSLIDHILYLGKRTRRKQDQVETNLT